MTGQPPDAHAWVAPKEGDSRSPCPGLNILCNHGYLPHDGKNISTIQLIRAMMSVYHISLPLAIFYALAGILLCGHGTKLDMEGLAAHGPIEHDASLVHDNVAPGKKYAPTNVNPALLQALLSDSSDGQTMTLADLGKTRGRRNQDALNGVPLTSGHAFFTSGEATLILMALGGQGELPKNVAPLKWVEEFIGQERLPEGWSKPKDTISVHRGYSLVKQISKVTPTFK